MSLILVLYPRIVYAKIIIVNSSILSQILYDFTLQDFKSVKVGSVRLSLFDRRDILNNDMESCWKWYPSKQVSNGILLSNYNHNCQTHK